MKYIYTRYFVGELNSFRERYGVTWTSTVAEGCASNTVAERNVISSHKVAERDV